MNVTIIGTGKMARAISIRMLDGGHQVTLVGHTPGRADALVEELKGRGKQGSITTTLPGTLPGEVVVLAVPYPAVQSVVHQFIELLPGKILADITNPVDIQKMEMIVQDGSAAEEIAHLVPVSTHVVKAFNTNFARRLIEGEINGMPLDVFIAGNDANAKLTVGKLIEDGGLHPIDVGSLERARQLEALGFLELAIQVPLNLGFKSAFKLLS